MAKAGELTYLSALGEGGKFHAANKPFSDKKAGRLFIDIGMVRSLLPAPPARLLDLGCGTGWTSCFFAMMGYDVVGQDIARDMIQAAIINKQRYGAHSANFVISDYESLDFHGEFDAACFYDSLHHAEDERLALEAVFRALKPGGVLVTHEPGEGHSIAEHSIRAMESFGVTEKDMPPYHIVDLATEIGFSSAQHFPFPGDVVDRIGRLEPRSLAASERGLGGWIRQMRLRLREARHRRRITRRITRLLANSSRAGGLTVLIK